MHLNSTNTIFPILSVGDIFSVYRINLSQYGVGFVCPCDALLLQGKSYDIFISSLLFSFVYVTGSVVMNESVLTGESIPQSKVPLLIDDTNKVRLIFQL